MAEKFAFKQRGGEPWAVCLHKQVIPPTAPVVNQAAEKILSRACFPRDQNGFVGFGYLFDDFHNPVHLGGGKKEVGGLILAAMGEEVLLFLLKMLVGILQRGIGQHVFNGNSNLQGQGLKQLRQLGNPFGGVAETEVNGPQKLIPDDHRKDHG